MIKAETKSKDLDLNTNKLVNDTSKNSLRNSSSSLRDIYQNVCWWNNINNIWDSLENMESGQGTVEGWVGRNEMRLPMSW